MKEEEMSDKVVHHTSGELRCQPARDLVPKKSPTWVGRMTPYTTTYLICVYLDRSSSVTEILQEYPIDRDATILHCPR